MNYNNLNTLTNYEPNSPVLKVHKPTPTKTQKLIVPFMGEMHFIDFEEISYIKAENGLSTIVLTDGRKCSLEKSLNTFEAKLGEFGFLRTHKSYIVNANTIKSVSRRDLVVRLENNEVLPIARRKYEPIMEYFTANLHWI